MSGRGVASVFAVLALAGSFATTVALISALILASREQLAVEIERVSATARAYQCATFAARLLQNGVANEDIPRTLFNPTGPSCKVIEVSRSSGNLSATVLAWYRGGVVSLQFTFLPGDPSAFQVVQRSVNLP